MDNPTRARVLSAIKRVFSRSAHRRSILNKALSKKKGPRGGKMYECASCKRVFSSSSVHVDHIDPVVPIGTPFANMGWDEVIRRIWCDEDNLQVLCIGCHKEKSKQEAAERKAFRDKNSTSK